MWISNYRYEQLIERIERLERDQRCITFSDGGGTAWIAGAYTERATILTAELAVMLFNASGLVYKPKSCKGPSLEKPTETPSTSPQGRKG